MARDLLAKEDLRPIQEDLERELTRIMEREARRYGMAQLPPQG